MSPAMHRTVTRRVIRIGASTLGAAVALVVLASPALAHVTIHPSTARQGSYQELTFRVPNEEDQAATTELDVFFPDADVAPVASVSTEPVPGWTATVKTTQLKTPVKTDDGQVSEVASEIAWTADSPATALQPGQYQDFNVSAGPLPQNVDSMTFKAVQTYSNGDVVRWIEVAAPGQPEPEHPAPVLTLTPARSGSGSAPASGGQTTRSNAATTTSAAPASGSVGVAEGLAVAALVVSVVGVGGLAVAMARRRSQR